MDVGAVLLSLPLAAMIVHRTAVWIAATRKRQPPGPAGCEPVTWLRPLKAGVPGLEEKLVRFLGSLRDEDQAIFGVAANSDEARLCEALAACDARVKVAACDPNAAANPKVAKLLAMTPHARHERWILADAEARIDADFARDFTTEWKASGADVQTAGYRFAGMKTWPQWLDALAVIQTLWPGLELVRAFGRMRFTLGACTGVRRTDVEGIGGWAALGDALAEDQQLGARLAAAGKTVRLSEAVLSLEAEPMTWHDYWRHQRRVAVTYRVAAPAGAFGMILTRGFSLSLALAVVFPSRQTWLTVTLAAGLHLAAVAVQTRRVGGRVAAWALLSLIADVVETVCWAASWGSNRVWWGGKWRVITPSGQIVRSSSITIE